MRRVLTHSAACRATNDRTSALPACPRCPSGLLSPPAASCAFARQPDANYASFPEYRETANAGNANARLAPASRVYQQFCLNSLAFGMDAIEKVSGPARGAHLASTPVKKASQRAGTWWRRDRTTAHQHSGDIMQFESLGLPAALLAALATARK